MAPIVAELPDGDGLDQFYGDPPIGVRANMVRTADGASAFNGTSQGVSNNVDHALLLRQRSYADVVLVGSGTARAEGYGPVRLNEEAIARRRAVGQLESVPIAIVTGSGHLDPSSKLFSLPATAAPIVVTTAHGKRNLADGLIAAVGHVLVTGEESVSLPDAVAQLADLGLQRVQCEGGPTLLADLVDADLVAELCLTISPLLAGSQPVGHPQQSDLQATRGLSLRHVLHRDGWLFLRWSRS